MLLTVLVSGYAGGPDTVNTSRLDSFRLSSVQMAPSVSQSSVAGRVITTSRLLPGLTVTRQRMLWGGSIRRTTSTLPPTTVNAWSLRVRWLKLNSSLNLKSKVKMFSPSWESGVFSRPAVSGGCAPSTASVAALVSVSSLPISSVNVTRTLMVLPSSASTGV